MKANKEPEKIYYHKGKLRTPFAVEQMLDETDVEYTRTDAFIEKACEWIKDNGSQYIDIVNGQLVLKKGIIKELKNYMKGK